MKNKTNVFKNVSFCQLSSFGALVAATLAICCSFFEVVYFFVHFWAGDQNRPKKRTENRTQTGTHSLRISDLQKLPKRLKWQSGEKGVSAENTPTQNREGWILCVRITFLWHFLFAVGGMAEPLAFFWCWQRPPRIFTKRYTHPPEAPSSYAPITHNPSTRGHNN